MTALSSQDLFRGEKVRLTSNPPQAFAQAWSRWQRDSVMKRMLNEEPAAVYSQKSLQDFFEKADESIPQDAFLFQIHTLEEDRLIGHIRLSVTGWEHGEGWVGMVIGDQHDRGRGYGTDALRLVLRYAFDELNLHRVTLGVFAYNARAIHTYEKLGFRMEGLERAAVQREGRRYDSCVMGMLRQEWQP